LQDTLRTDSPACFCVVVCIAAFLGDGLVLFGWDVCCFSLFSGCWDAVSLAGCWGLSLGRGGGGYLSGRVSGADWATDLRRASFRGLFRFIVCFLPRRRTDTTCIHTYSYVLGPLALHLEGLLGRMVFSRFMSQLTSGLLGIETVSEIHCSALQLFLDSSLTCNHWRVAAQSVQ
jgi:hypothetical protein